MYFVAKVPNQSWSLAPLSYYRLTEERRERTYLEEEGQKSGARDVSAWKSCSQSWEMQAALLFIRENFPTSYLSNQELMRAHLGGDYSIDVRWFDRQLNEVSYPKTPGRYAYYAEIIGANGLTLKKSATLFCAPKDWMGWNERLNAALQYFPINKIPQSTWEQHQEAINEYAGFTMFKSVMNQEGGAVLLSFIDEMYQKETPTGKANTPAIIDGDYHARLKQKILGVEGKYPALNLPVQSNQVAPKLHYLPDAEADGHKEFKEAMKKVGEAWMAEGGEPFDMVVARDGKIIYHDQFGENLHGAFTTETPSEIASITKLFTGMLFAQFVDQGLIGIDDHVGKYLPDFPTTGPNAVTLRQCFTHTAGFDFFAHGVYDGVHNAWLENVLIQALQGDTIATRLDYNGMGYDLAGKVMEVVTGKSIFRLLREYLYDPLEMNHTIHDWDLGYSVHSTAYDLAKVAQMLLNKGTYGDLQFFSEETYQKITPKDLSEYYPQIKQHWGIGITGMDWKVKDEKSGEERFLVSEGILGHGSATSSMFWVIPKYNMVITQSRRRGSAHFGKNYQKMMEVVEAYLINPEAK